MEEAVEKENDENFQFKNLRASLRKFCTNIINILPYWQNYNQVDLDFNLLTVFSF